MPGWSTGENDFSPNLRAVESFRRAAQASDLEMARPTIAVAYLVLMIAVIVAADILFFRNHFWERLMVNIGIVLVFAAFYLRFLKQP
jgi:hypothetical protein